MRYLRAVVRRDDDGGPTARGEPGVATDADLDRLRALVGEATFDERYQLVRSAGQGGMGQVLEARDRDSGERVAIKVLDGRALPDRQRFVAEAEILERLAHPRIVGYVAHGTTGRGEPYLAMQWLDGETLAARLRRGPLSIDDTIALAGQLADALAYAHAQGVIHRDVKPANVMLVGGAVDDARLLDFGVARRGEGELTRTGQVIGTPGFMAPEQALGRRGLDARADLFGLGCTLYAALTGATPFAGDEVMEVLARVLLHEPTPVEEARPDVPARLANLVAALMAKDPAARLADAGAVVREAKLLAEARAAGDHAALAERPHPIAAAARAPEGPAAGRRRWWPLVAAGAVVIAGALLVAWPARSTERASDAGAARAPGAPCSADIRAGCAAACAAGDGEACYFDGEARALGFGGLAKDPAAAVRALVRGCDLGSGRACTKAGVRLLDGLGGPGVDRAATVALAARVLAHGCELGSGNTCRRLGLEHLAPGGRLGSDDPRAIAALTRACELGDHPSCWVLVDLRDDGRLTGEARAPADAAIVQACAHGARHRVCAEPSP